LLLLLLLLVVLLLWFLGCALLLLLLLPLLLHTRRRPLCLLVGIHHVRRHLSPRRREVRVGNGLGWVKVWR
jgi:hypothetical protein